MIAVYTIHILAGTFALLTGYSALYVKKGGVRHKKLGHAFIYAMLTMAALGMIIASIRGIAPAINIPSSLMTAYLVVTAYLTVKEPHSKAALIGVMGMAVVAFVVLITSKFALDAFVNGGKRNGIPAFPFLMYVFVGCVALVGDVRILRSGPLKGGKRLARHLWRMCFALFLAALAFFIGQAHVFPKVVRIPALLAMPVLAVLVIMFYWLWRVRTRHRLHAANASL